MKTTTTTTAARTTTTAANNNNNNNNTPPFPGRQVADANYFLALLHHRHEDLSDETNRLLTETTRVTTESNNYDTLSLDFETTLTRVRDLEGTLADYNIAFDKLRNGVDPDDVESYEKQLVVRNKEFENEIDEVFLAKKGVERESVALEEEISGVYEAVEDMFNDQSDGGKVLAYRGYIGRTRDLHLQGRRREGVIEALRREICEVEGSVRGRGVREEYGKEEANLELLRENIGRSRNEIDIFSMDPKDAHALLLGRVKDDQRTASDLEKKATELDLEIQRLTTVQYQLQNETSDGQIDHELSSSFDPHNNSTNNDDKDNLLLQYQTALEKDDEIMSFLENADATISEIRNDHRHTQSSIVALLEHISHDVAASEEDLPGREYLEEVKDETNFKTKHLETSERTVVMLKKQRLKRLEELQKIDTLEDKISLEHEQLADRRGTLKAEILRFSDLASLRARATKTEDYLTVTIQKYAEAIRDTAFKTKSVSSQLEKNGRSLKGSDTRRDLESWEQKLRYQGQNIFSLQEFIASKGKETDFETFKGLCAGLVERLNGTIVETL